MSKYSIEVVLVHATYDTNAPVDDGKLPILRIDEVEKEDYPIFVHLGEWMDGGELLFQPYLQAKIEDQYQNVDIAVRMNESKEIKSVSTQAGDIYQKYIDDNGVTYFLPPRKWEINRINRKLQERAVSHYNACGREMIQITFENHVESMQLISGKTDEENDFYKELIRDLVSIHQELCIDQKSSMSMALKWTDDLYEDTEKLIKDFCDAFRDIEKNAQPELKRCEERISFNKAKKLTQQAIIDHEIFHKEKVTAVSYREAFDTFEHRVIKTYMARLQKLIETRQMIETDALQKEKIRLQESLNFSGEELARRISVLNENIERNRKNLEYRLNYRENKPDNLQMVNIQFQLNKQHRDDKYFKYKVTGRERPKISLITHKKNASNCKYRIALKNGWSEWLEYKTDNAVKTQYVNMSIPADCVESAAFLYEYLDSPNQKVNNGDIVGIWGEVLPGYAGIDDKGYSSFNFHFRNIQRITVFHQNILGVPADERSIEMLSKTSQEDKKKFTDRYREYLFSLVNDSDDDSMGFFQENIDIELRIKELNTKLENERKRERRWSDLKLELEKLAQSRILKETKDVRTEVQSSNLFSFNPYYQRIYRIMMTHKGAMEGIDFYSSDEDFKVAKLPELYETWCCVKILLLFINNYGFRMKGSKGEGEGVDGLKNLIRDILDEKGILNDTKFDLVSNDIGGKEMQVSIWYDREYCIDKNLLIRQHVFAKRPRSRLRPDLVLQITYCGKTNTYIFDAKYRGNQKYDGMKDLCEVAFQKYMLELGLGTNENICGSFILHSSTQTVARTKDTDSGKIELKYDAKKYLGDYPDEWLNEWIASANEKKWNISIEQFMNWSKWFPGTNNNENKIGIITFTPKCDQLAYIIQMIMERQFGLYGTKCWICGGKVVEENPPKYTAAGNRKYHYKCQNSECGKFMVETHCINVAKAPHTANIKLGKHSDNYYAKSRSNNPNACWNVSCPVCRQIVDNQWDSDNCNPNNYPSVLNVPDGIAEELPFD